MSDCFVLYLLLTCMKKKTSGADKFTNNTYGFSIKMSEADCVAELMRMYQKLTKEK